MAPNGAGECGGGCRRGKAAHACVGAVAGFFVCLLMVWAVGKCGRLGCGGVAEDHEVVPVGQFNLSRSQLQALAFLLSSTQKECMINSGLVHDGNQVNGVTFIPDILKDAILQEFCTAQDKYGLNSDAPAVLEDKLLQNVIQEDISSTTQCSVTCFILFPLVQAWSFAACLDFVI